MAQMKHERVVILTVWLLLVAGGAPALAQGESAEESQQWSELSQAERLVQDTSIAAALLLGVAIVPAPAGAQHQDLTKPAIEIVSSVGCATKDGASWTLTQASEPLTTDAPFSSGTEIEVAKSTPLGSRTYVLIGVTEFLAPEALLGQFQRAEFTTADSVNSTGSLVTGHRVLVKGLFIEHERINLTSVIGLTERCG